MWLVESEVAGEKGGWIDRLLSVSYPFVEVGWETGTSREHLLVVMYDCFFSSHQQLPELLAEWSFVENE